MNFHVVTPCLTPNAQLERTIESIHNQSLFCSNTKDSAPEHTLHHVIQTRSSKTIQVPAAGATTTEVVVDADTGIYDALRKGFEGASEDIDFYFYLGAGDMLSPNALEIVIDITSHCDGVEWLTGMICGLNDQGHMTEALVPFCYRRNLIACGAYGRYLPYIQQESTFWSARLHKQINWDAVANCKFAGDALIWQQCQDLAHLYVAEAWLGAFERRNGQVSEDRTSYLSELRMLSRPPSILEYATIAFDRLIWSAPRFVKRRLGRDRIAYNPTLGHYTKV